MRKTYKKRREESSVSFRKNNEISAPEVKLIDDEGQDLGIVPIRKALDLAIEREIDLVEVSPKSVPPVAKLMDYGKFFYQKEKQYQKQKAKQKKIDIKGIRLSLRIGDHDRLLKQDQTLKFLEKGDKVRVEMILKGRENQYTRNADEMVRTFIKEVNEKIPIATESPIEKQGNRIATTIYKK